jgi:hypothetical protein
MNNFKQELLNNGFCIIKNALPNYNYYLNLLEKSDYEIHQDFLWDLRIEVKKYFEIIYNSTNLACSFDTYRLGNSPSLNWHIDQNQSHKDYLNCVQGVIILKDSNVTRLLSKSHLYFKELSERISDNDNNTWEFYEVPENDKIWKYNLKIEKPELEAGDILLFDSRLVHCADESNNRAVVFISMMLQDNISNCIKRKRKLGFLNGEQTTHWCDRYILVDINGPKRKKIPKKYKNLISDI